MHLAKTWIAASAQSSPKSSTILPSTPQYLLAVGNMGTPGFIAFRKSARYYFRRRSSLSPVFTQSTLVLGALIFTSLLIMVGDIWIHVSSTAVSQQNILTTDGLNSYSRGFAPPDSASTALVRLQQGLQTYLDVSPVSTVRKINGMTILVPVDIPAQRAVVASTIGMHLDCGLINLDCTFDQSVSPITFDCSNAQ